MHGEGLFLTWELIFSIASIKEGEVGTTIQHLLASLIMIFAGISFRMTLINVYLRSPAASFSTIESDHTARRSRELRLCFSAA